MPDIEAVSKNKPAVKENKTHSPDVNAPVNAQAGTGQLGDSVELAMANAARLSPRDVIALQRTIGNRGVTHMIQAKLKVGAADDSFEREADQVAEQVLKTPEPAGASQAPLQRQENRDEIQTKPVLRQQEDEIQTEQTDITGSFNTSDDFEKRMQAARGSGQPLPGDVRAFMEPRFGADFSAVRLHTGSESANLNREVSARAFTLGSDIFLGEGEENVNSLEGRGLLAHELTHVTQQTGIQPTQRMSIGDGAVSDGTIRRFMSLADWKQYSSKAFSRRSAGLKKIDNAVAAYNAIPKDKTSQRLEALNALDLAIGEWLSTKNGSSSRMDAVKDLRRDVDVEFLALTMEIEQNEHPKSGTTEPEAKAPKVETQEDEETSENEKASPENATDQRAELARMMGEMDSEELETLRAMIKAQKAMIEALKVRHAMAKEMPPEKVDALLDEIKEQIEISDRIGEALGRPLSVNSEDDESLEAELEELRNDLKVEESDEDRELRLLEAELEADESESKAEFGSGFEVEDPDAIADELADAEAALVDLESEAREKVKIKSQEGKIISSLLPLFMAYKAKKDEHGAHGIKTDVVQDIIETMMAKSEFSELYELDYKRGDLAIEKAIDMAFGETWTARVENGNIMGVSASADGALKEVAAPVRVECERIAKATKQQLQAAFEVLAQAQLEAKKSGERSISTGPVTTKVGGSASGYIGAKATGKVSAEINKLAKSISLVAEASAQAGMGGDMVGFIRAGLGEHVEFFSEAILSAFFGVKGSAKASFTATLREIRAEAEAKAMVGAEATGEVKAGVRIEHFDVTVDAEGEAFAGAKAEVSGSLTAGIQGISLKGSAEAFAGVKASGSVGGSVNYKDKKLFSIRAKGEALAGAGAGVSGEFTFHNGKLTISGEASLTLGLGLTGGTEMEIDFKAIGEAVLAEMKEYYDLIFPPDIDRRSPDGPREAGLTSEERGKLYMAIYPAFAAYGQHKQDRGEHGIKRERLQALLDKNVILNKDLVREVKSEEDGTTSEKPLYRLVEADEVLIFAALSALPGQLNSINIQAGQIRSMDAVKKDDYIGLKEPVQQ